MSKLKAIHLKYRQAMDSGKKSGHGRVIMCYFNLCNKIWGGSPATVQISSGLESTDLSPTPPADGGEPSAVVPAVAGLTPEGPHDTEGDSDKEEGETDPLMSQQPPNMDGAVHGPSNEDHDFSSQRRSMLNQLLRMWDMAKQTKMAAVVRDFTLAFLLVSSTGFDEWCLSKDQTKDK